MRPRDTLRLAFIFLVRRRTRTLLTIVSVAVSTVCMTLLVSVGIANYSSLADTIASRSSLTEIRVTEDSWGITSADVAVFASIAHVAAASPVLELPGSLHAGQYVAFVPLTGVDPDVLTLRFAEGGMFSASSSVPELVIGAQAAREFIDPENPPDYSDWEAYEEYMPDIDWLSSTVEFQFGYEEEQADGSEVNLIPEAVPVQMRVCGLTAPTDDAVSGRVYVNLDTARELLNRNAQRAESMGLNLNSYREAIVRADSMDSVPEILAEVRRLGYEAYSDSEYIEEMRGEQSRQLLQLSMMGVVSLLVSALGIANTMYASVLERKRDIGVFKVLGMSRRQIQHIFLIEAGMTGLAGGAAGLAAAFAVLGVLNAGLTSGNLLGMYFSEGTRIQIPLWVGAGAMGAACLTGVIAGQWPAAQASRMSALDAMRR